MGIRTDGEGEEAKAEDDADVADEREDPHGGACVESGMFSGERIDRPGIEGCGFEVLFRSAGWGQGCEGGGRKRGIPLFQGCRAAK